MVETSAEVREGSVDLLVGQQVLYLLAQQRPREMVALDEIAPLLRKRLCIAAA
jgi:hypothetical protein